MRAQTWTRRLLVLSAVIAAATTTGCKTLTERYIALEVWKYEKCFGHLPPGFTPPGAAAPMAAPPRVCGQAAPCAAPAGGCDPCQGHGTVIEGGVPAGMTVPAGPGGSPGPGAGAAVPTPAGITAGKPIVISDEVVTP